MDNPVGVVGVVMAVFTLSMWGIHIRRERIQFLKGVRDVAFHHKDGVNTMCAQGRHYTVEGFVRVSIRDSGTCDCNLLLQEEFILPRQSLPIAQQYSAIKQLRKEEMPVSAISSSR